MVAYIKDLLRFHDYVIIPTLGGFITHYEPAKRSISTGTIAAPSKKIAFNQSLREDDGLLINYLVTQKGISQAKAKAKVLDFIEEIQEALNEHDFYLFSGIGKLQLDVSGNYQFLPILKENLLLDSYGLERVVAQPIQRIKEAFETTQDQVINIATQQKPIVEQENDDYARSVVKEKPYQPWFFRAAAVIGMGFIMTTVGISLFSGNVSGDQLSLFPVQQKVEIFEGIAAVENNIDLVQPKLSEVHLYEEPVLEEIAETTNVVTTMDERKNVSINNSNYNIIVGSFLDEVRMNREIANMEAKGFTVQTLEGPNGYTRVALVFSTDSSNKYNKLQEVRANVNPDAWMVGG